MIGTVIGVPIVIKAPWMPAQASTQAHDIDLLFTILAAVSIIIFSLVASVIVVALIHFRRRPGRTGDGPPLHGNTKVEIIWTVIPTLIVTAIAVATALVLSNIEKREPGAQVVLVTGQQFGWGFKYEGLGLDNVGALHMVKDKPYRFLIKSKDVIHSFWVPEFRMKEDAVPGLTTKTNVTPTKNGSYNVVCAELCGLGHATMKAEVVVQSQTDFDRWAQKAKNEPPAVGSAGSE